MFLIDVILLVGVYNADKEPQLSIFLNPWELYLAGTFKVEIFWGVRRTQLTFPSPDSEHFLLIIGTALSRCCKSQVESVE